MLLALIASLQEARSAELTTPSFRITIATHCDEGSVSCDKVSYIGVNKKSGATIKLRGATHHTICADGVTPCRFLGYVFDNGNMQYFVSDEGTLQVTRNGREVLVQESGVWKY